jgi:hypothetical protein
LSGTNGMRGHLMAPRCRGAGAVHLIIAGWPAGPTRNP